MDCCSVNHKLSKMNEILWARHANSFEFIIDNNLYKIHRRKRLDKTAADTWIVTNFGLDRKSVV